MPKEVIHSNQYVPTTTSIGTETKDVEDNSLSFEHTILSALTEKHKDTIEPVLEVGLAGSGKTTALEKLVLDWAAGQNLQHFSFVFYFNLKELNTFEGMLSLETLLLQCHSQLSPDAIPLVIKQTKSVLFMFDGLEQYMHNLDLKTALCSDPHLPTSVSCLVLVWSTGHC